MTEPQKLTPFQQALLDSVLEGYKEAVGYDGQRYIFSEKFENWFRDFCRNNTARRVRVRGIIRKVLIAAVIIALLVGTVMAIPAVREAVIDFFTHDYVEEIAISFDPQEAATAPGTILSVYQIAFLPNGYDLSFDERHATCVVQWWTDQTGQSITFIQYTMPGYPERDSTLGFDAVNSNKHSKLMGDYLVEVITTDKNRKLIWTNNAYFFTLEIPMSVTDEEMELIFASWGPKE